MRNIDFFNFFRYMLAVIATVYATTVTLQSIYGWYAYLNSPDKYMTLIRRYVVVQGLRMRFRNFWGDVLICVLLSVVCLLLWQAHAVVAQIRALEINAARTVTIR